MLRPAHLHADVRALVQGDLLPAVTWMLAEFALFNVALFFTYFSIAGTRSPTVVVASERRTLHWSARWYLVLGLALFALKVQLSGGVVSVIRNVGDRVQMQRGLGIVGVFAESAFMITLVILATQFARSAPKRRRRVLYRISGALIVIVACNSIYGGRKAAMQSVLAVLMIISARDTGFARASARLAVRCAAIYFGLVLYFISIYAYRTPDPDVGVKERVVAAVSLGADAYLDAAYSMSYVDNYIVASFAYDDANYLRGAAFSDIGSAFVPSSLMPDKPAVDDGFYLRLAAVGRELEPGTPAYELRGLSSWPPETFGVAQMNGGVAWTCALAAMLGIVLALSRTAAASHPASLWLWTMLPNVYLNFEISNLRIVTIVSQGVAVAVLVGAVTAVVRVGTAAKSTRHQSSVRGYPR